MGFRGSSHLSWLPGRHPGRLQFFEAWMGQLLPLKPRPLGHWVFGGFGDGETLELMKGIGAGDVGPRNPRSFGNVW